MTLETKLEQPAESQRMGSAVWNTLLSKSYWVDATAAWIFYTPFYAVMELTRGQMETSEVLQNRVQGLAVQAATMLPYRRVREWFVERAGVTPESATIRKWLVDTGAVLTLQAPAYAAMLLCSRVSAEEFLLAYPAGLGLGIALHGAFGFAVDHWRRLWGTKPTLY